MQRTVSNKALSTLNRFQMKTELFCSVLKKIFVHTYRFRPSTQQRRIQFENAFIPSVRMLKWTRRMSISIYRPAKLARNWKPHGSVCQPFWILTVKWSGVRSCLFWWRHRFQIASFSPSTLENSVFKKHRFQIVPLWRAFSNGSVSGNRFRRYSVDDSRIRSKTAPFSFENGLVWTGPKATGFTLWQRCGLYQYKVTAVISLPFISQITEQTTVK